MEITCQVLTEIAELEGMKKSYSLDKRQTNGSQDVSSARPSIWGSRTLGLCPDVLNPTP